MLLKFYAVVMDPKSKNAFDRVKIRRALPLFCPNFSPVMPFQWEGPNTTVTRSIGPLRRLRAQTTCL